MLRLTLLRHAKSSWDDSVKTDFDRPLNAKGRRAASVIGAFMARALPPFDMVVASPALRVRQTIEGVEDGLGRPLGPVFDARIYMAGASTLAELVGALPHTAGHALLVGHNPGLEDLLLWLVPEGGTGRETVEEKYPTASLAELELDVPAWDAVAHERARLARFTRPRDLDSALGPDPD